MIDAAQDAVRQQLRNVRTGLARQRGYRDAALTQASASSALIKQLNDDEDTLLSFLAVNGWLTEEDTKSQLTDKAS